MAAIVPHAVANDHRLAGKLAPGLETPQPPLTPQDVTSSWLTSVLHRTVKSCTVDSVLPGTATKVFISILFEGDVQPTHMCIKGGFNASLVQSLPLLAAVYQREVDFYNKVAPLLDHMQLPHAWWAGDGLVVLDRLPESAFVRPRDAWPVARVLAGVEQLAALHSRTWHVQPADYPWLTGDYDAIILQLMDSYQASVSAPGRPALPAVLNDQARMIAALKKHYELRNPKFQCLLHGDAHVGNTYLVDGAPRFLDWQIMHIGSALHDVAYFVCGALAVEDRRAREWDILGHYLRTLERLGVEPLFCSDEDVVVEYKKSITAGVGWLFCSYQMQAKEDVDAMALRYRAALTDHRVVELIEGLPEAGH